MGLGIRPLPSFGRPVMSPILPSAKRPGQTQSRPSTSSSAAHTLCNVANCSICSARASSSSRVLPVFNQSDTSPCSGSSRKVTTRMSGTMPHSSLAALTGTAGVGGGDQAERGEVVGILLALADLNGCVRWRRQQLGQAIRNRWTSGRTLHPVPVLQVILWERLLSALGHAFDDFEVQCAFHVAVEIFGHLAADLALTVRVVVATDAGIVIVDVIEVIAAPVSA